MNHFSFIVNDEPYSLWDPDPATRTTEFLDSIDPAFFSYLAEAHAEKLDSAEHKRRVATATRMAYLHGIETLMTLAAAAVQAPQAPYAWVALAKTDLLRGVIERISKGDPTLHSEITQWNRTWAGLAQRVFAHCTQENGWPKTAESFGRLWSIFAGEFLNEMSQAEYNSLKHGFRIRSSGVKIAFGLEHQFGVAPPPEEMKYLGGSDTGSTFYAIERAGPDVPGTRSKRSRRHTVNWEPEPMIRGLQLIDVSIRNIVAFIRIANGAQPHKIQFHRLEGVEDLPALLDDSISVRTSSFDTYIPDAEIPATTRKELLAEIEQAFATAQP
ncbi:MAG TPA: hypothetical protein VEC19_02990 [Usitatibacter sp.]|nr:hypothetical protein [Usitatibacter sp.]